jgi:hypothetical protein
MNRRRRGGPWYCEWGENGHRRYPARSEVGARSRGLTLDTPVGRYGGRWQGAGTGSPCTHLFAIATGRARGATRPRGRSCRPVPPVRRSTRGGAARLRSLNPGTVLAPRSQRAWQHRGSGGGLRTDRARPRVCAVRSSRGGADDTGSRSRWCGATLSPRAPLLTLVFGPRRSARRGAAGGLSGPPRSDRPAGSNDQPALPLLRLPWLLCMLPRFPESKT